METGTNKRKFAKRKKKKKTKQIEEITCEQKTLFSTSWLVKQQRTKKQELHEIKLPYSY